jgi:energy-coupling factor transport system permease protein
MKVSLFVRKDSYLHRFDPRAKFLLMIFSTVYLFVPVMQPFVPVLLASLILVLWTSLGLHEVLNPIRSIWPVLLMITLLTPPFYADDAFAITAALLLRFTSISYIYYLYFRSTQMSRIILTLRWFGLPYQGALVITIAIRFIPYLAETFHQIRDAHKLRSGGLEQQLRPWKKVQSLIPVLTSVMIYSIKGIPMLSMSLEHRGLGALSASGAKVERTAYKSLRNDTVLFTHLAVSVMIAVIFISLPWLFN